MNLISINGYKRSGKGETAKAIEDLWPRGAVKHMGFANKVKVFAALCLGFSRDRSDEELIALMDEAKEAWDISLYNGDLEGPFHDLTGRQYLQEIGTRARQMFGEDFWVDQVLPTPQFKSEIPSDLRPRAEQLLNDHNLEARYPFTDCLVFSDLRFENEADRTRILGGEVWRVERPGTESDGHDSEQRLPDYMVDRVIVNDGTLDDLRDKVAIEIANLLGSA